MTLHVSREDLSVEQLKQRVREAELERKRQLREQSITKARDVGEQNPIAKGSDKDGSSFTPPIAQKERKDGSPVKPLSSILNISRVLSTPHTPAQVSALWNAYHMSRSQGTGRGFVCASIPMETYRKMTSMAAKYPTFVIPVPRPRNPAEPKIDGETDAAYEFYYLQWNFHGVPPTPYANDDPFKKPKLTPSDGPETSTVLFTPLQEYKLRLSFATPYLVLTNYTDLAQTHGIVLLRGEITPNANMIQGQNYMLSQSDAQFLAMSMQKFYLWDNDQSGQSNGRKLLKQFHEEPTQFKWEDLLEEARLDV
ncbi:hypothetical protein AMATHDRAFT_284 [Amanita thiersii Skay4041]|uniref:ATP11-domain-containing protein n=1 Tax=Amanita thiersii Skay4041 TaxID=703135 RepID=A0A2A9P1W0_9AGAR|nr:hypothetical protein AMATHDRAFT_284 [Amanita thiersii Skay4041]